MLRLEFKEKETEQKNETMSESLCECIDMQAHGWYWENNGDIDLHGSIWVALVLLLVGLYTWQQQLLKWVS